MSSYEIQNAIFASSLILVSVLFYRAAINNVNSPKGLCLLLLRLTFLAAVSAFSAIALLCFPVGQSIKDGAASFSLTCALVAGSCIVIGNFSKCGKKRSQSEQ
jgi:hypothetical protein